MPKTEQLRSHRRSRYSQENTYVGVSSSTLLKRDSNTGALLLQIFKNTYFEEQLRKAASELTLESDCLEFCSWKVAF